MGRLVKACRDSDSDSVSIGVGLAFVCSEVFEFRGNMVFNELAYFGDCFFYNLYWQRK